VFSVNRSVGLRLTAAAIEVGLGTLLVDARHTFLGVSAFFLAAGNFVGALAIILEEWERTGRS
jgi:uncharacterized membrane protein